MWEERLRRKVTTSGIVAVLLAIVAGGGCEMVVGDTLPSFTCVAGVPGACPTDSICVPSTHRCVARARTCLAIPCGAGLVCDGQSLTCLSPGAGLDGDVEASDATTDGLAYEASTDAPVDSKGEGGAGSDGGLDGAAGDDASQTCSAVTCTCVGDSACDTNICADQLTVTGPLFTANGKNSFCIQGCCTSSDCPGGTVCFATGAGGNYCVAPSLLDRNSGLGEVLGGGACTSDADCRSGVCFHNACSDTCCTGIAGPSHCATDVTGIVCRFAQFNGSPNSSFDAHVASSCGPGIGNIANNQPCVAGLDGTCASGRCLANGRCSQPCRRSGDCPLGQACIYGPGPGTNPNVDLVAACTPIGGGAPVGASCTVSADCQSNLCDGAHCSDVCFSDGDCKAPWHCHPQQFKLPYGLGGSFSILSCVVQ